MLYLGNVIKPEWLFKVVKRVTNQCSRSKAWTQMKFSPRSHLDDRSITQTLFDRLKALC
jgi:hypothetical protein